MRCASFYKMNPFIGLRQGNYRRKRKVQKGAAGLFSQVFCGWDPKSACIGAQRETPPEILQGMW